MLWASTVLLALKVPVASIAECQATARCGLIFKPELSSEAWSIPMHGMGGRWIQIARAVEQPRMLQDCGHIAWPCMGHGRQVCDSCHARPLKSDHLWLFGCTRRRTMESPGRVLGAGATTCSVGGLPTRHRGTRS
jgi:hypothetical protein